MARSVANAEQMDRLPTRESFHLMALINFAVKMVCRFVVACAVSNPMPIIMVTAKGEEVDHRRALEIGADDYIPKPFNLRELLARIRAVLRRQANELPGSAVAGRGRYRVR